MNGFLKTVGLLAGLWTACSGLSHAQPAPIKIGELNSYKALPALMGPYRKGWELAQEFVIQ